MRRACRIASAWSSTLVYGGENRREMWLAIEMAGGTRTRLRRGEVLATYR